MYWYSSAKKIVLNTSVLLLLSSSYACNKPEIKETGAELKYFDLKGYFEKEAVKLDKSNPEVDKTVTHNGSAESKKLHIIAWKQELNLFTESDINKPAWRNSYTITSNGDSVVYTAKEPELKTRKIVVKKTGTLVSEITVNNSALNFLYNTSERLVYKPGLYYSIQKDQQVKVMGNNNYQIKGILNGGQQQ